MIPVRPPYGVGGKEYLLRQTTNHMQTINIPARNCNPIKLVKRFIIVSSKDGAPMDKHGKFMRQANTVPIHEKDADNTPLKGKQPKTKVVWVPINWHSGMECVPQFKSRRKAWNWALQHAPKTEWKAQEEEVLRTPLQKKPKQPAPASVYSYAASKNITIASFYGGSKHRTLAMLANTQRCEAQIRRQEGILHPPAIKNRMNQIRQSISETIALSA